MEVSVKRRACARNKSGTARVPRLFLGGAAFLFQVRRDSWKPTSTANNSSFRPSAAWIGRKKTWWKKRPSGAASICATATRRSSSPCRLKPSSNFSNCSFGSALRRSRWASPPRARRSTRSSAPSSNRTSSPTTSPSRCSRRRASTSSAAPSRRSRAQKTSSSTSIIRPPSPSASRSSKSLRKRSRESPSTARSF